MQNSVNLKIEEMSEKNNYNEILQLETNIVQVLKSIYDPEIPVNIYDLGLIYNIEIKKGNIAEITMTLTAPNCPVADHILLEVKENIEKIDEIETAEVKLVFEPPWDQSMLSEEAKLELGMM